MPSRKLSLTLTRSVAGRGEGGIAVGTVAEIHYFLKVLPFGQHERIFTSGGRVMLLRAVVPPSLLVFWA
jgi:hypothetical protein